MHANHSTLWLDGQFIPATSDILAFQHNGALEEIAVYRGSIFKLQDHLARLFNSSSCLLMRTLYKITQIERICRDLVAANNVNDGYINAAIFLKPSSNPIIDLPQLMLFTTPRPAPYMPSFSSKSKLNLITSRTSACQLALNSITSKGLLILNSLAKQKAIDSGFDDALLLDDQDFITSTTSGNIFLVKGGALHTPSLNHCPNGITRIIVIDLALKSQLKVTERSIKLDEIGLADELFLTSTSNEITAISSIEDHKFNNHLTTEFLYQQFSQLIPSIAVN